MRAAWATLLFAVIGLLGSATCSPRAPHSAIGPVGCSRAARAKPSASVPTPVAAPSSPRLAFDIDRGCAQDVAVGPAKNMIADLAALCAPAMPPLTTTQIAGSGEVHVPLQKNSCVRIGVVADPPSAASALVLAADGTKLAERADQSGVLLLGRDGPVCTHAQGDLTVRAQSLASPPAQLHVAVWGQNPAASSASSR